MERLEASGGRGDSFAARQITTEQVATSQLVIVAGREHRAAVTRLFPKALPRTHALLDLAQLADQVSDQELSSLPAGPSEHLAAVVELLASKRGRVLPLSPEEATVHDPFRQGPRDFDRMQTQIEDALPRVLRVLDKRA